MRLLLSLIVLALAISGQVIVKPVYSAQPSSSCASIGAERLRVGALERTTCGPRFLSYLLGEAAIFHKFREKAGEPRPSNFADFPDIERLCVTTSDQRTLDGYKIPATSSRKGHILVAQGNAILADRLISSLTFLTSLGLDVYVFEYRGYGLSSGKSRMAAIMQDYLDLTVYLSSLLNEGEKQFLYGISFGSALLLHSANLTKLYSAAVFDSTPNLLKYECLPRHDPTNNIPEKVDNLLFIFGDSDLIVPSSELVQLYQTFRKARIEPARIQAGHWLPVESDPGSFALRRDLITEFLSGYIDTQR